MITQYIHDDELKKIWDIDHPEIRPHHQRIVKEWIETADEIRSFIHNGENNAGASASVQLDGFVFSNINKLDDDMSSKADGQCLYSAYHMDLIIDAYIEWGVRNYPITDRITQYTLEQLKSLYNGDDTAMIWDTYCNEIGTIAQYQADRNRKPIDKMSRSEMIRDINNQSDDTIRKMMATKH